jgi:hypothetical protein
MFITRYPERKTIAVWDIAVGVFNFDFDACDNFGSAVGESHRS